jgi:preprotein translocase subunit SecG
MLISILTVVLLMTTISIIVLVLLQQGKGADAGAAFGGGGGSSQSVFGSRGSSTFLSRITAMLAVVFFATSLGLAYLYMQINQSNISVTSQAPSNSLDVSLGNDPEAVVQESDLPSIPDVVDDEK